MKKSLLFACCCWFSHAFAQDNLKKERDPFTLTLSVHPDTVYQEDINPTPYLDGPNVLQIYPGEKVFIEVKQQEGIIQSMQTVKENKNPAYTLEIAFSQTATNGIHELMMLKIFNPFNMSLSYSARMFLMRQKTWLTTNVMTVHAGLTAYETWPNIIISLGLAEWKFVK